MDTACLTEKHRLVPWESPWHRIGNNSMQGGTGSSSLWVATSFSGPCPPHPWLIGDVEQGPFQQPQWSLPRVPCTFAASLSLITALRWGFIDQGVVSIQRGVFTWFGGDVISQNLFLLLQKCAGPFLVGTVAKQMSWTQESSSPCQGRERLLRAVSGDHGALPGSAAALCMSPGKPQLPRLC